MEKSSVSIYNGSPVIHQKIATAKPKDLLLVRKFVRRMKGGKVKIVNGQIYEKAANIRP